MSREEFHKQALQSLLELATEEGINASGRNEAYGCIFGRDSAITILKIIKALSHLNQSKKYYHEYETLITICRRSLLKLVSLQGTQTNIESGEEAGKFIHEYRTDKFYHLAHAHKPWFVYPDGTLKNYDSIDSTPLGLLAIYKFWKLTGDSQFLLSVLPAVERGLNWIITYGDKDKDMLLEYEFAKNRSHGGLVVQSWTDSSESLLQADGTFPDYPIAPVEVQGYAWLALRYWSDFYADNPMGYATGMSLSRKLSSYANGMKKRFNNAFIMQDKGYHFAAQALDGYKNQIKTITGNPLLLLWATYDEKEKRECILEDRYIDEFIARGFWEDLFDKNAGIRTMSSKSPTFNPTQNSYHNGSFWPKLNGMIHEGLENWGHNDCAIALKESALKPLLHFGTPIELYVTDSNGMYLEYKNELGRLGCRQQAWSAAVALEFLVHEFASL